ncbi:hypothetical protein AMS68_002261 [Peltaster fructicola]|uniref:Uncharacterized protein n=1 Tax=Peltaster fructicola TaxID=286661 RepID=A0A6H0XPT7_9PEZI|nr:hypothetical protein AMS68_002261 [Peltaster fructicola]
MVESTESLPGIAQSSRDLWQVLVGEDDVQPIIEACSTGNDAALHTLLSESHWRSAMSQKQHVIHAERSPKDGTNDREVYARAVSNLERALIIAAKHRSCSSDYSNHHQQSYLVVDFDLLHGALPLYEAVRLKRLEVARELISLGADPLHPVRSRQLGYYRSSLMSWAAMYEGPQMIELLLEHNLPIAGTGALHTAAAHGQFDTVRVLMDHGADVNEKLPRDWTPMHFAAWRVQPDAMVFLESCGARPDAKDTDGKTPADVFEQYSREQQLRLYKQHTETAYRSEPTGSADIESAPRSI